MSDRSETFSPDKGLGLSVGHSKYMEKLLKLTLGVLPHSTQLNPSNISYMPARRVKIVS